MGITGGSRSNNFSLAGNTTYSPFGDFTESGTESTAKCGVPVNATLKNLHIYIRTNTIGTTTTATLRINGGDGNSTVSITGDTTGVFQDTSNTDSVTSADEIDLKMIFGVDGFDSMNFEDFTMEIA